jgi:methanethiol S-methyltransferase
MGARVHWRGRAGETTGQPPAGSPAQVIALLAAYGAVHSLLASRQAKALVCRAVGTRYRNGLYRFAYNAQAVGLFVLATRAFLRLPDRTLYRVPVPWSWLMYLGQLAGLGLMGWAAWGVGLARITGLAPLCTLITGARPDAEPEAQGPAPDASGRLRVVGPFRFTRHPANWGPLPFVLLFPHMTVNRATLAGLSVAYLVAGSVHEEFRLHAAYGGVYECYRRRVPFLLPGFGCVKLRRSPLG